MKLFIVSKACRRHRLFEIFERMKKGGREDECWTRSCSLKSFLLDASLSAHAVSSPLSTSFVFYFCYRSIVLSCFAFLSTMDLIAIDSFSATISVET